MKNTRNLSAFLLLVILLPATAYASEIDHIMAPFVSLAKGIGWFIVACIFLVLIRKGIKDDRKRGL
jgi:C4-dicarboxylate transporter